MTPTIAPSSAATTPAVKAKRTRSASKDDRFQITFLPAFLSALKAHAASNGKQFKIRDYAVAAKLHLATLAGYTMTPADYGKVKDVKIPVAQTNLVRAALYASFKAKMNGQADTATALEAIATTCQASALDTAAFTAMEERFYALSGQKKRASKEKKVKAEAPAA